MLIDDTGNPLSQENIMEMAKTHEGRQTVKLLIMRARIGFCTQETLDFMNKNGMIKRDLTAQEMQEICDLLWTCMFDVPTGDILAYTEEVAVYHTAKGSGFGQPESEVEH